MIRKYSLMFFFFALQSCLTAQNFLTKPVKKDSTTSVNLGPAVLPVFGIRFQYWIKDYLSINAGLSYMLAAGGFNAWAMFTSTWKLLILILAHVEYFYTT